MFNDPRVPATDTVCNALPKSKDSDSIRPVTGSYSPKPGNIDPAILDPSSPAFVKKPASSIVPPPNASDDKKSFARVVSVPFAALAASASTNLSYSACSLNVKLSTPLTDLFVPYF